MSDGELRAECLFCERDDRILFDQLSFSVEPGEIVQIEGQNGSGKTTLLRIMAGLSRHFEGDIFWNGESIYQQPSIYRSNLLYFGHQPGVKALLTPLENLSWYSAMHPSIEKNQVLSALKSVGLLGFEDVPCYTLSAGQQRRVALARLYLSQASLWILDEPFTAIDKKGVAEKESLIGQHAAKGGSVLLTTHHELAVDRPIKRINLDKLSGT